MHSISTSELALSGEEEDPEPARITYQITSTLIVRTTTSYLTMKLSAPRICYSISWP